MDQDSVKLGEQIAKLLFEKGISSEQFSKDPEKYVELAKKALKNAPEDNR